MTGHTVTTPLARLRQSTDLAAVSALFTRCVDDVLLQDGEPLMLQDARDLFNDVPEGRLPVEPMVFGLRGADVLDAVVATLPNHPEHASWYVPFMLVDPQACGRGVGTSMHAALARYAVANGARRLQLVVLDGNDGAGRFWSRLGYRAIGRVGPHRFKSRQHSQVEMQLELPPA